MVEHFIVALVSRRIGTRSRLTNLEGQSMLALPRSAVKNLARALG
jgi:hypothetical protein